MSPLRPAVLSPGTRARAAGDAPRPHCPHRPAAASPSGQELPGSRAACRVRLLLCHYLGKHSHDAWSPELETRRGQETPVRFVSASRKPSPASAGSCARDGIRRGRLRRGAADTEAAGKARLRRRAGPGARGHLCDRVCSASGVSGPGSAEYLRRLCSARRARSCPAVTLSLPTGRAAAASGRGHGVGARPGPPLLPQSGPLRDTPATGLAALTENRVR